MRVLGIDPGTLNLGYGIVDEEADGMTMVDCGVLSLPSKIPVEQRLSSFYIKLGEIVNQYQPDEVAIEEPFVAGNARSALAIGRAQAIAILAAANKKLPVFRYLPTQVKQQVADYGSSSKEQVQELKIRLGRAGQSYVFREPSALVERYRLAVSNLGRRVPELLKYSVSTRRASVERSGIAVVHSARTALQQAQQRIDELGIRIRFGSEQHAAQAGQRLVHLETKLKMLNPLDVLGRGYSLTCTAEGAVIRNAGDLKPGDRITTRFETGKTVSNVEEIE